MLSRRLLLCSFLHFHRSLAAVKGSCRGCLPASQSASCCQFARRPLLYNALVCTTTLPCACEHYKPPVADGIEKCEELTSESYTQALTFAERSRSFAAKPSALFACRCCRRLSRCRRRRRFGQRHFIANLWTSWLDCLLYTIRINSNLHKHISS